MPTICCEAVVKPNPLAVSDNVHSLDWLPVPGRSSASQLPRPSGRIETVRGSHRRHQSRLGCRLNAGDVEWAERHGCRESRPPPWMAVGGGPTERRRSEGTRGTRAKPGAGPFWLLFWLLKKVTRRKGGTNFRATTDNGYSPNSRAALKAPSSKHRSADQNWCGVPGTPQASLSNRINLQRMIPKHPVDDRRRIRPARHHTARSRRDAVMLGKVDACQIDGLSGRASRHAAHINGRHQ